MLQRTRNYAKDYIQSSDNGAVQYAGKRYCFALEEPALRDVKHRCALLLFMAVVLYAGIGLLDSTAFGGEGVPAAIYVLLPYVALLFPLGLACGRAAMLAVTRHSLEFAQYDQYMVQQKGLLIGALALAGCLVLGLAALLFILVLRGSAGIARELISLAAAALCWGSIVAAYKQHAILLKSVLIRDALNSI